MNITTCPKWTNCQKVRMLLDKDFGVPALYHQLMENICLKCEVKK